MSAALAFVEAAPLTANDNDPLGRLWEVAGASGTTRFLYDGDELVAELSASGAVQRRYVHGASIDDPVAQYEGAAFATRRFLHADRQGSIVAISDNSGAATTLNAYEEYGRPNASNAGRFQYTGQIWLPELALYHYKARLYDPGGGRFLQTDPVGYEDDLNLYQYVGNDPLNRSDPTGRQACESASTCASHRRDRGELTPQQGLASATAMNKVVVPLVAVVATVAAVASPIPGDEVAVAAAGSRAVGAVDDVAAVTTRTAESANRQSLMGTASRDAITRHQAAPPSAGAQAHAAQAARPSSLRGESLAEPPQVTGAQVGAPARLEPPPPESRWTHAADLIDEWFDPMGPPGQ